MALRFIAVNDASHTVPPTQPQADACIAGAGLRLAPGGDQLTRTWIVYNKPSEPNYTHAGMLMALGLMGAPSSIECCLLQAAMLRPPMPVKAAARVNCF